MGRSEPSEESGDVFDEAGLLSSNSDAFVTFGSAIVLAREARRD